MLPALGHRTALAAAWTLAACLWALPTMASAGEPVIVTPTVTGGELAVAARERLEARLREAVRKSDLSVVNTTQDVATAALACEDDKCRAIVLRDNGARYLLVPSISVEDQDYALKLTLFGARGQQIATLEETCSLCGLAEAEDVLADLGARIGRKVEVASRASALTVTSDPAGARVFVGDELVGTTPFELPLEAGSHALRIELDGYITQQRNVDVVAGENQDLPFRLQQKPVDTAAQHRQVKVLKGLGWTSLALGLGALSSGVALIVLDEKPITSDCSGANVDIEGNCRWRYSTLEGGIGVAVGGAVLIGTATALLVAARKRSKSQKSSNAQAIRLRPSAGGLTFNF